ncbi:MAG: hypothetical protein HUU22_14730 [Phycisphaerae bacterium]|nr:hypothetical protein [Phycisphaerae bacterium]NUQ47277.1 hypothetical protein [Phycisphaerae bacterium]
MSQIAWKSDSSTTVASTIPSFDSTRDLITSIENKWGATSVSKYEHTNDALVRRTSVTVNRAHLRQVRRDYVNVNIQALAANAKARQCAFRGDPCQVCCKCSAAFAQHEDVNMLPPYRHGVVAYRATISALLLLAIWTCASCTGSDEKNTAVATDPKTMALIEFVSLSRVKDGTHTVQIQDAVGMTWFREAAAGVNLADIECAKVAVEESSDWPGYALVLPIVPSKRDSLEHWTRSRVGTVAGIVVAAELRYTAKLVAPIRSPLVAPGFAHKQEAEELAGRIRAARF